MENKKVSLSTVFLVIAIILIIVMGALLYMQKNEADRQIAELRNNASQMQETISDLQGKIDTISNTINSDKTSDSNVNEITKLSDEKVKEVLQNYLNLTTAPNASIVMLEKLNLVDEIEYITDETIPEDHMKINIEYSAYKEKMLNYVTESWLDERFGKAYYEKDGLLCCFFDPGSTGEKEVKSVTLKEGATYSAEIYVTELSASIEEQIPISETIEFTIENSNGKCVISHCKY